MANGIFTETQGSRDDRRAVSKFTSSNDVIDAISCCIKVLEPRTAQPEEFTKLQALRVLVHFVNPCTAASDTTALMDLAPPLSVSLLPHMHLESLTIGAATFCFKIWFGLILHYPRTTSITNKVYTAEQLTRAVVRLAQVLDSVKWQCLAKREDAAAPPP